MWIAVKLFEYQRAKLDSIESYQLHFKGLTHVYTTSNALLYPLLDTKESTLTLRLRVKNASHKLLPGMYATVYASAKAHIELTLPRTAVIHKNGKYYVFLVGEFQGEYEPFAVDVETLDSNTYRIIKGLDEGDEVVDNALFMMDSDAQINALY